MAKTDQWPSDHPFRDTLRCDRKVPERACNCRLWMDVIQERGGGEPSHRAQGCFFDLFPWLISGAIHKNNELIADVNAVRGDIQRVEARVTDGMHAMAEGLRVIAIEAQVSRLGGESPGLLASMAGRKLIGPAQEKGA